MHLCHRAYLPAVLAAFLVSCTNTPTSSQPDTTAAAPTATVVGEGPEHALQKGMTADAVKQIMGNPAEIKLMPTTTGKAEVWVYHRTVFGHVEQVQVGSQVIKDSTSGSDGVVHTATLAEVPIYKQAVHKDLETISLLMFDGKFISQKRTVEKQLEYQ
jgi:outer membrane protein assembly factor BamE (lipoprotein component of BamABCDE complex)